LQKGFPRNFNFLPQPKLIKDTPSQIIKQKRKTSELKRGLSSPGSSCTRKKKQNKEPATLTQKKPSKLTATGRNRRQAFIVWQKGNRKRK